MIANYCRANQTSDGVFHNVTIAEELFPERVKANRNSAIAAVFTATKRRSVGESKDPYFFLLGDAKFRLATPEERIRASVAAASKRSLT